MGVTILSPSSEVTLERVDLDFTGYYVNRKIYLYFLFNRNMLLTAYWESVKRTWPRVQSPSVVLPPSTRPDGTVLRPTLSCWPFTGYREEWENGMGDTGLTFLTDALIVASDLNPLQAEVAVSEFRSLALALIRLAEPALMTLVPDSLRAPNDEASPTLPDSPEAQTLISAVLDLPCVATVAVHGTELLHNGAV